MSITKSWWDGDVHVTQDVDPADFYLDPHSETARELFGEVTPETRARAKEINLAALYGAGDIKLARRSGSYPTGHTFAGMKIVLDPSLPADHIELRNR